MTKKDLKVVNVNDLQPETQDKLNPSNEQPEDVSSKISIDDISNSFNDDSVVDFSPIKKVSGEVDSKEIVRLDIENNPRFKKYTGNGSKKSILNFMTVKHRFDKREFNTRNLFFALLITFIGITFPYVMGKLETVMYGPGAVLHRGLFSYTLIGKYWYFILGFFLYIFPLRQAGRSMVEIYYDGINLPSETFPIGRAKRRRVKWGAIENIEMKGRSGIPYVSLIGKNDLIIGEMRLDLPNREEFYKVLDTYCPLGNPLRKLFDNS